MIHVKYDMLYTRRAQSHQNNTDKAPYRKTNTHPPPPPPHTHTHTHKHTHTHTHTRAPARCTAVVDWALKTNSHFRFRRATGGDGNARRIQGKGSRVNTQRCTVTTGMMLHSDRQRWPSYRLFVEGEVSRHLVSLELSGKSLHPRSSDLLKTALSHHLPEAIFIDTGK